MNAPSSTYRLQFNAGFTFIDALPVADYLAGLGISCVYASPIFHARPGSMHGYDIIDPLTVNPEIGTLKDFEQLAARVRENGLLWLQDIVPNHMAYCGDNALIRDILEKGRASCYVDFFDVEWDHPYESLNGKLLAPFLGTFYARALEDGLITLSYDINGLAVNYYSVRLPLRLESYATVFSRQLDRLKESLGADDPDYVRLVGVLYALKNRTEPDANGDDAGRPAVTKESLWDLYTANERIRDAMDAAVTTINGTKGVPESFNALEKILAEQLFRLSFWKVAAEEINYRRFFNINELISLCAEKDAVFRFMHEFILRCLERDRFSAGIRVDHIDGLYDPENYLHRLKSYAKGHSIYVEKILHFGEELPETWPVQGTTGYDFLNYVNGLFCRIENEDEFTRMYDGFLGFSANYRNMVFDKKRLIIGKYMAGDIDSLAQLMKNISNRYRYGNDITLYGLKRALVDVLALFPIYRTYISAGRYSDTDRIVITRVMEKAKQESPGLLNELSFIEDFLLLHFKDYFTDADKAQWIQFVMRFQQYTGPLMAKGFEDTVLYVYNRLISLNEVGGNPARFGIPADEFHRWNRRRAERWPHTLNATATHDTKRGEDARARINVLSEIPGQWRKSVKFWNMINRGKKGCAGGREIPDINDEYHLYQTLIGTFPFYRQDYAGYIERVKSYAIKAVREAKVYTAWLKPDDEYEGGFAAFIDAILSPDEANEFLKDFVPFQKKIAECGICNSLSQTLLKIASPGVPDFYQGTETWDLNMVDPDNRRSVDFSGLADRLRGMIERDVGDRGALIDELLAEKEDGRIKQYLIYRLLRARNRFPGLLSGGEYIPLSVTGRRHEHIIAFARRAGGGWAVAVAPRFPWQLVRDHKLRIGRTAWGDTAVILPSGTPAKLYDAVTGHVVSTAGPLRAASVLERFPVSLLLSVPLDTVSSKEVP
jgi:(1->4)-alpha-D-glucan 1-alpha-D-glucosylmutase